MRVNDRVYGAEPAGWWPSDDEVHRFGLWRCWDFTLPPLIAVCCNPSTATDVDKDPTVDVKLTSFARRWGRGGVCVGNLYALRNKDPKSLGQHPSPIGRSNHLALSMIVELAQDRGVEVLVAWGGIAKKHGPAYTVQVDHLVELTVSSDVPLRAFRIANDGTPYHPLYLPGDTQPVAWEWVRP